MDDVIFNYIAAIGGSRALAYIGANTGQELEFCKKIADQIYAFEPITLPSVWNALITHADNKTKIFDVALSDTNGIELIYPASNNFESSSLLQPNFVEKEYTHLHFGDPIAVKTQRFDSFDFANTIDTLIIDVQGAEYRVLQGITNYSNLKLIVLEYTVCPAEHTLYKGNSRFDQIYQKLYNNGLEFCQSHTTYFNPQTRIVHSNAIFMRF